MERKSEPRAGMRKNAGVLSGDFGIRTSVSSELELTYPKVQVFYKTKSHTRELCLEEHQALWLSPEISSKGYCRYWLPV